MVGGRRLRVGSLGRRALAAFLAFTAAATAATATATSGFAGLRRISRRAACSHAFGSRQWQQLFIHRPRRILTWWPPGFTAGLGSPLGAALSTGRRARVLPVAAGSAVVAAAAVRAIASLATPPGIVAAAIA